MLIRHLHFQLANFFGDHAQLLEVDQIAVHGLVAVMEKGQILPHHRVEGNHGRGDGPLGQEMAVFGEIPHGIHQVKERLEHAQMLVRDFVPSGLQSLNAAGIQPTQHGETRVQISHLGTQRVNGISSQGHRENQIKWKGHGEDLPRGNVSRA